GVATKAPRILMSKAILHIDRRKCRRAMWPVSTLPILALFVSVVTQSAPHVRGAEPELPKPRFLLAWGTKGTAPAKFCSPIGIAITPPDEILVTDHYNNRVHKFSTDAKLLNHFAVLPNPG